MKTFFPESAIIKSFRAKCGGLINYYHLKHFMCFDPIKGEFAVVNEDLPCLMYADLEDLSPLYLDLVNGRGDSGLFSCFRVYWQEREVNPFRGNPNIGLQKRWHRSPEKYQEWNRSVLYQENPEEPKIRRIAGVILDFMNQQPKWDRKMEGPIPSTIPDWKPGCFYYEWGMRDGKGIQCRFVVDHLMGLSEQEQWAIFRAVAKAGI